MHLREKFLWEYAFAGKVFLQEYAFGGNTFTGLCISGKVRLEENAFPVNVCNSSRISAVEMIRNSFKIYVYTNYGCFLRDSVTYVIVKFS